MGVGRWAAAAVVLVAVAVVVLVGVGLGPGSGAASPVDAPLSSGSAAAADAAEAAAAARASGSAVRPSAALLRVRHLVEDVAGADRSRYDVRDDAGRGLDGLKVVASGATGSPRYVGVHHHRVGGRFDVGLVVSDDLVSWRAVRTLQRRASQATIRRVPAGGFVLAWEQEPRNHLRIRHYPDLEALEAGRFDAGFDAPPTLAPTAEGTPDVRRVRMGADPGDSTIELGFHYYRDRDVDRQALGVLTDFRRWRTRARPALDIALRARGLRGNFGDRDTFALGTGRYEVVEGQRRKDDFGSWRTYLRDDRSGALVSLRMRVRDGQRAFGNPTVSVLPGPDGGTVLLTTAFAFSEGAPRGAGELLGYRRLR